MGETKMEELAFSSLVGKVLTDVRNVDNEEIVFSTKESDHFKLYHDQDCCESVVVESITGDLADLIGTPILSAEEATSEDDPPGFKREYEDESQTWTFYKLRTIKGSVDIRWYGSSNGFYSERVSFVKS
jgi:hypothetical protein